MIGFRSGRPASVEVLYDLLCEVATMFFIPVGAVRRQLEKEYNICLPGVEFDGKTASHFDFSQADARCPGTDEIAVCEFSRFTTLEVPCVWPEPNPVIVGH